MKNENLIFNTISEIGLRIMFILDELKPEKVDLDRLNYFDYLMLYMNDGEMQMNSLHPEYPMMLVELFAKKELLKRSLLYIGSKSLITIECSANGINYSGNINTNWFLDSLVDEEYSQELIKRAKIIKEKFNVYKSSELKELIETRTKNKEKKFEYLFPYKEGEL